jgi:2-polyprenyl-3-methyl-5-hydroxy-6-metoxy-1,4-benzoquinol methylase
VYNRRGQDRAGFVDRISFETSSLLRPGAALEEICLVPASPLRRFFSRSLIRVIGLLYRKPVLGAPVLILTGWFLVLGSWISNVLDMRRTMDRIRSRQMATSFHMMLRVSAGSRDGWRYAAGPQLRRRQRRRMGIEDGPARYIASGKPTDTAVILTAGQKPELLENAAIRPSVSVTERTYSLPEGAHKEQSSMDEITREPQYSRCVEVKNEIGLTTLGLMTNQVWHDDPRRLMILLSRYKFVAKMLSGRKNVGELGCGDAFGSRIVLQEVEKLTVYDFDPVFIEDVRQRYSADWPLEANVHDILAGPLPQTHDAIYSLDVIEHISRQDEHAYLANLRGSLTPEGVLIIGSPSLESQPYASPQSKAGHINCKSGAEIKALLQNYFSNVFLFSMNDEVVHTGFSPMAHYLLVVCCGKK